MSNFLSGLKRKIAAALLGEIVTDIGAVPADDDGTELRFTLRRSSAGRVFLDINRKNYTQSDHYSVHDLKACAAYLERAAQEMRKHLDAVPPA